MKLKNKLNKNDLRKIFSSYFEPSYMGKLNNLYLLNKILILLKKNFNSTQILKEISNINITFLIETIVYIIKYLI